ncbi:MAG: glycosyltransferase [Lachnospiraceae bacterium]|nr:glycosyltransferase [Lachnospiraceae bacterium]
MTFSIIVVCLNAGEKLRETIDSIHNQTENDYEIIIKDGGSTDETTVRYIEENLTGEAAPKGQIRFFTEKDTGIYDAMNQAVQHVQGEYVLFMNCGDGFYDEHVLERVKEQIGQTGKKHRMPETQDSQTMPQYIFYGNIYEQQTDTLVQSNPVIDDFACYRNVPCHQACFYDAGLLRKKAFDTAYVVRADYEHFLWCYYTAHAEMVYMPVTVALYEGGGFSETRANEKRSRHEHRKIVGEYMPASKVCKYRLIMALTLAPLRTWIARNPVTAGVYQTIKRRLIYSKRSA